MRRSDDRILTTHVGSIIRTPELRALAAAAKENPGEVHKFYDAVRAATNDVVKRQLAAGVDVVNDGEYGKSSWANYVLERVSGFERRPGEKAPLDWLGSDRDRFPEVVEEEFKHMLGTITKYVCTSEIRYNPQAVRRDIDNLK